MLHDVADHAPEIGVDAITEEDWIEDSLQITDLQPGRIWFEGGAPIRSVRVRVRVPQSPKRADRSAVRCARLAADAVSGAGHMVTVVKRTVTLRGKLVTIFVVALVAALVVVMLTAGTHVSTVASSGLIALIVAIFTVAATTYNTQASAKSARQLEDIRDLRDVIEHALKAHDAVIANLDDAAATLAAANNRMKIRLGDDSKDLLDAWQRLHVKLGELHTHKTPPTYSQELSSEEIRVLYAAVATITETEVKPLYVAFVDQALGRVGSQDR